MKTKYDWTRINNDVNGNPRYVIHFLSLNTEKDKEIAEKNCDIKNGISRIDLLYSLAIKRANSIGGKKYHTKKYGGGIVFQSYSLPETEQSIDKALQNKEK